MVTTSGRTVDNTKANIKKIRNMASEFINGETEGNMKDSGLMASNTD
jgi:hypothetical protein